MTLTPPCRENGVSYSILRALCDLCGELLLGCQTPRCTTIPEHRVGPRRFLCHGRPARARARPGWPWHILGCPAPRGVQSLSAEGGAERASIGRRISASPREVRGARRKGRPDTQQQGGSGRDSPRAHQSLPPPAGLGLKARGTRGVMNRKRRPRIILTSR